MKTGDGSHFPLCESSRRIRTVPSFLALCVLVALCGCSKRPAQAQPAPPASPAHQPTPPDPDQQIAGIIFGTPVSANNYYFAKRVAYTYPQGNWDRLSDEERERAIWEALILHYESFRRGVTVSEEELTQRINAVLRDQQQSFTRSQDPAAYARWTQEFLGESVEAFEHQMRYLLQIEQLKTQVRESLPVAVTEDEMRQEFLNEKHHVGGEMVVFDTKDEAQAFYEQVKDPARWDEMKASGKQQVRPVGTMTLEAYIDLWSIPKEQIYAFHDLEIGSVGPPMPFGQQWCVYRLLDKRTGDLENFPKERDAYERQLKVKKQYEGLKRWIEEFKRSANLKVFPIPQ